MIILFLPLQPSVVDSLGISVKRRQIQGELHRPHQAAENQQGFVCQDLLRSALGNQPVVLAKQIVALGNRFQDAQVVRGWYHRFPGLPLQVDKFKQSGHVARVQPGGGLIQQPDLRGKPQHRSQGHTPFARCIFGLEGSLNFVNRPEEDLRRRKDRR